MEGTEAQGGEGGDRQKPTGSARSTLDHSLGLENSSQGHALAKGGVT